jgi:response regulator of citrate/malate metabolism
MPSNSPPPSSAGSSAEAEKTQKMEEKAAEYQRHAEEVRNMEGTEQEKIDAMNSLDQERRELNEMSEGK